MGASSVTGVGQGRANHQKGPGNGRNYFVPSVNPHVVAAGTLDTAVTTTVTFPNALTGSETGYAVILTTEAAAAAGRSAVVSAKTDDASGNFESFTVAVENAGDDVMWMVVNSGYGLEVTA